MEEAEKAIFGVKELNITSNGHDLTPYFFRLALTLSRLFKNNFIFISFI